MRICIIKIGADGDVIRTIPIAKAIKQKFPSCTLTWITGEEIKAMLEGNPYIDELASIKDEFRKEFDILYNFDMDKMAFNVLSKINAKEKYGFYEQEGFPSSFNLASEYYLNTIFDDDLKKENKKTYQQMIFEAAELNYNKEHDTIYLTEEEKDYAKSFLLTNGINGEKIIGIHLGASSRWPSKTWHIDNLINFIKILNSKNYTPILFGGPNEKEIIDKLKLRFQSEGIKCFFNNPNNTKREFAALIDLCDKVICGDSLALHVALALKKLTIGLFFCTSPNEIEDYGLLRKIISPKLYEFFPEKQDQYDEALVKSISPEEVFNVLNSLDNIRVINAIIKNDEEKFLLIKRKEGIHNGKWAFPGGVVEVGETLQESLMREIKEETNLKFKKIIKKIANYEYLRPDGKVTLGESYFIEIENGPILINTESDGFVWATIEEIQRMDTVPGIDEEALLSFE
ncbi:NUDIX domain-containing protein [Candidatus Pacearchaeota archaeon]|nr:NUDIX domain-containing protein [Candidatus Pacearchaeota archaeon]